MNKQIEKKLEKLPTVPGVYFHKDINGEIIYIGKAANLRNRVRQYFQVSRIRDPKTDALVSEIADIEWTPVDSEIDALFLEAELVRRYLPRYNILLRDDKSSVFVRINYSDKYPSVTFSRRPLDDKAQYFGPFWNGRDLRQALHYLRKIFPYSTHSGVIPKRACLQYHLGLCPGIEENKTSISEYRANLRNLIRFLKGERIQLMVQLEKDMKVASKNKNFEEAAKLRNQLSAMKSLGRRSLFLDSESLDISKDKGIQGLTEILGLANPPRRIEGYDISHMSGTDNAASMVVFKNGLPDKASYRKFKMRILGNDDFAHMNEVIGRRLTEKNRKDWGMPDLILIDGGRGQLSSAIKARDFAGLSVPMIGLAKREEEIIVKVDGSNVKPNEEALHKLNAYISGNDDFQSLLLSHNSDIVKLLQRIRDESHRFAVSYHSVLKTKRQTVSALDGIPGIGPTTRKKLFRAFGSKQGIIESSEDEIAKIVGKDKALNIKQHLS
jgi:excinuclease ABC subunit C